MSQVRQETEPPSTSDFALADQASSPGRERLLRSDRLRGSGRAGSTPMNPERWMLLGAIAFMVFLLDTVLIYSHRVDRLDLRIHHDYINFFGTAGTRVLATLTLNPVGSHGEFFALEIACFVLAIGGWLLAQRRVRSAFVLLAAILGALGLEYVLKTIIKRPGPALNSYDAGLRTFPSGHTTVGVTFFLAGAYLVSRAAPVRLRAAILVSGVVLALGIVMSAMTFHLPTEVVGGIALACLWVAVLLPLSDQFTEPPVEE